METQEEQIQGVPSLSRHKYLVTVTKHISIVRGKGRAITYSHFISDTIA